MNDAIAAIALGRRIDLTREADFLVGGARIRPTACEVAVGDRRIRLQPRVMQVLIMLARAGGEPVSREALTEVCWGQVAVSDDALNRCIQRLRRLAEAEVGGAFSIETIARIGYRLAPGPGGDREGKEDAAPGAIGPPRARLLAAGGLAALALAAIAAIWMRNVRPARWTIERSERLAATPLLERQPALSPDGTMLAYSAGPDDDSGHIYLKHLTGGEPIQLTDGTYHDASPAWSPDGGQVAYVAGRANQPCRIMVAPVPAGLARQVGRCQYWDFPRLAWTAKGDGLLFTDAPGPSIPLRIMRLELASGRRTAVTHPPGGFDDMEPILSPDGRWLLYSRESFLPDQIIAHNLATGAERILARLPQGDLGAAWAEDSKSVFVVGETTQGMGIWSYPIDGGARDILIGIGSPMQMQKIATAPGGLLAAEILTGRYVAVRPPGPGGKAPAIVDPANSETWSPAFAPDGTMAMASNRSGDAGVWLMRPGGRARMLLALKDATIPFGLAWSPDGAELAFITLGARDEVRVVSASGLEEARIKAPGTKIQEPAWTSDGRALVFPVRDGGGWRIWRADLGHPGAPHPITGCGWDSVRAAGGALYATKHGQPGIWRLGPKPKEIATRFSGQHRASWRIFKDKVVFEDDSDPKHPRLLWTPLGGGAQRPFADLPQADPDVNFGIDPRTGTPVYIAALDVDSDIELFHLVRR